MLESPGIGDANDPVKGSYGPIDSVGLRPPRRSESGCAGRLLRPTTLWVTGYPLSTHSLGGQEFDEVIRTKRFIHPVFTEPADLDALNHCVTRVRHPVGGGSLYVAPVDDSLSSFSFRHSRLRE